MKGGAAARTERTRGRPAWHPGFPADPPLDEWLTWAPDTLRPMPEGAAEGRGGRVPDWVAVIGLLVLGLLLTLPYSGPDVRPHFDGLFYEAQKRELQGESRDAALDQALATDMADE